MIKRITTSGWLYHRFPGKLKLARPLPLRGWPQNEAGPPGRYFYTHSPSSIHSPIDVFLSVVYRYSMPSYNMSAIKVVYCATATHFFSSRCDCIAPVSDRTDNERGAACCPPVAISWIFPSADRFVRPTLQWNHHLRVRWRDGDNYPAVPSAAIACVFGQSTNSRVGFPGAPTAPGAGKSACRRRRTRRARCSLRSAAVQKVCVVPPSCGPSDQSRQVKRQRGAVADTLSHRGHRRQDSAVSASR